MISQCFCCFSQIWLLSKINCRSLSTKKLKALKGTVSTSNMQICLSKRDKFDVFWKIQPEEDQVNFLNPSSDRSRIKVEQLRKLLQLHFICMTSYKYLLSLSSYTLHSKLNIISYSWLELFNNYLYSGFLFFF